MNSNNKPVFSAALIVMCLFLLHNHDAYSKKSIVNSKHDLSVSGGGKARASMESRICYFCHTPHHAARKGKLWHRELSTASYTPYSSSTMFAAPGQPTGDSKLCLSCHDGTIALGKTFSKKKNDKHFHGGVTTIPVTWDAYLGTNLSDDHPISFKYQSSGTYELLPAGSLANGVKLDQSGELQCTSCHNVHDDSYGHFLVASNIASNLCISCHDKTGWNSSLHKNSAASWRGSFPNDPDPWPKSEYTTVLENGCGSCHFSHTAPGSERLLTSAAEEWICFPCHNGKVALHDIESVMEKQYAHPMNEYAPDGMHDPTESYALGQITPHVECVDCHNPHMVKSSPAANAPYTIGQTIGVPGIQSNGEYTEEATFIYEICFKCHGDPLNNVIPNPDILRSDRQEEQTNTLLEFAPANASFHPVEQAGQNRNVPNLLDPWDEESILYCHDCHGNDDSSGPQGPHGSDEEWILSANYDTLDNTMESGNAYALCYKCHDRDAFTVNSAGTNFQTTGGDNLHKKHVAGEQAPCSACHDPHGVPDTPFLINFDTAYVHSFGNDRPGFVEESANRKTCILACHGKEHDGSENFYYPERTLP